MGEFIESKVAPPDAQVSYGKTDLEFLGALWNQEEDSVGVLISEAVEHLESNEPTKRNLLKALNQIFDPLMIIPSVSINSKIILQHIWSSGLDLNQKLPPDIAADYQRFVTILNRFLKERF